jgi:hypothetical protein
MCGLERNGSEQGLRAEFCERRNRLSPFTQAQAFFTTWATINFKKRDSLPCSCLSRPPEQHNTKLDFRFSQRRVWRWLSFGMFNRVVWYKFIDILDVLAASIIRAMNSPDDGGSKHLWDVGKLIPDHTAQHPRRESSSWHNTGPKLPVWTFILLSY